MIVCNVPINEADDWVNKFFKINFHNINNRTQIINKNSDTTTTKNNSVFIRSPHFSNLNNKFFSYKCTCE